MKRTRILWCAGFAAALLILFLVTRYAMPGLYTPEWAARQVFWPLAAVIFLPVLYGKIRFSAIALGGYIVGLAAGELLDTLEKIAAGELPGTVQDPALVTMTTKLKKRDGAIDWNLPAAAIEAMIRAYTPWPGATFTLELNGEVKTLMLTRGTILPNTTAAIPGTVVQADRKGWVVACGQDALQLDEVIPPGKKAMTGSNYLNGCRESLTGKILTGGCA